MRFFIAIAGCLLAILPACTAPVANPAPANPTPAPAAKPTRWLTGDPADVGPAPTGGLLLAGGGTDVDAAMRWLIARSGGGDLVVIRASGSNGYNDYIFSELTGVNSVETLLLDSREFANDPDVETTLRNAEAVFIAGGNQADYVNFWKDTKVEDALNYLINARKAVVGGTSAGCAVLGRSYFSALNNTITAAEALANPYAPNLTLGHDDFLNAPQLANLITDSHFANRDRQGRLLAFLARMSVDRRVQPRGIGVDERTAVCIAPDGMARLFGSGTAYFLRATTAPETCVSGQPLHWSHNSRAVPVYALTGTADGSPTFDLNTWTTAATPVRYFYADNGTFGYK
jgi:cyanophycinase